MLASNHPPRSKPTYDDGKLSEELVSDIQQEAQLSWGDRLSKRVKEAEEVPRVLVGNLTGKGHVNCVYLHAYRHPHCCISNPSKVKRPLTDDDLYCLP